jgi:flagellar hook-associated protein 1
MPTLSDILNTGSHSLRVQQLAMQIVGQNTANVDTEGYTRRRLELTTAPPSVSSNMWDTNGGVDVLGLGRVRDRLIDEQIRSSSTGLGYWTQKDDTLGRVEEIFSEMGGSAISDQLQQFWSAWQDLSNNPEDTAPRLAVVEKAQALASGVRRAYGALAEKRQQVDGQIVDDVNEANTLTEHIAKLNVQIVRAETSGQEASDLRDQRDLAIDRLSQLLNIKVQEGGNGSVNIYNSGQILVQSDRSFNLTVNTVNRNNMPTTVITYGDSGRPVTLEGGEIKAFVDMRDEDIGSVMSDLNAFAQTLAQRVNSVHRTGYGVAGSNGFDFFAGDITGAADFRVSQMITDDPSRVATASSAGAPGDNSIALSIAGIQNERIFDNGRSTADAFYRDSVLRLGTRKAYASDQLKVEQAAMDNLQNRRQQVSGVSMDEEMTRLVQIQHSYEAAAKVVSTVDQMMQTILDMGA